MSDAFTEGWQYHQAGDLRRAEEVYRAILRSAPRHARAWFALGTLCAAGGRLDEATACLRQALDIVPGDEERHEPAARALLVEVAPGELLDKITILQIKGERITAPAKLRNVGAELQALAGPRASLGQSAELADLTAQLKAVNEQLWDIEDAIRLCERARDFGPRFIELARSVYMTNDRRAAVKRAINELLNSHLVEEKSYADYAGPS